MGEGVKKMRDVIHGRALTSTNNKIFSIQNYEKTIFLFASIKTKNEENRAQWEVCPLFSFVSIKTKYALEQGFSTSFD